MPVFKVAKKRRVRLVIAPLKAEVLPLTVEGETYFRLLSPEDKFEPEDEVFVQYIPVCERIPSTWIGLSLKNITGVTVRRRVKGKPPFPRPDNYAGQDRDFKRKNIGFQK